MCPKCHSNHVLLIAQVNNSGEGIPVNLYHCFDCKKTMIRQHAGYQVIDSHYFTERYLY